MKTKSFSFSKDFKFLIVGKAVAICALVLICAVVFSSVSAATYYSSPLASANAKRLPIYSTTRTDKAVAFSFDAAWGNEDTDELIKILDKYNVKTTFFVVGEWVDKYPESVKALFDARHEIMNHSNTHPHMTKLSANEMKNEIESCNEKIEKITGRTPTLFRAPFGEYSNDLIATLDTLNMYCIQWDIDSRDWKEDYSVERIVSGVVENAKSGSICLFHNAAKNTPKALPIILEKLIANGYEILPVSKLIMTNNFTIDHDGRQIANTTAVTSTTILKQQIS